VEGCIESLAPEVAPFNIHTMLVEPGFFRTELLSPASTRYAQSSIDDYAERTEKTVAAWDAMNGQQGGDPAKLADALVQLADQDEPPPRFVAGPTPWKPSRRRRGTSWPRRTPTASCRTISPSVAGKRR
jgi:NAD(P)-dependent dehydrogenase (short-subunit alcohol dehydrogenase family)